MKKFTNRWPQSGHFFHKLGHFFQFSKNGSGDLPPPSHKLRACTVANKTSGNIKVLYKHFSGYVSLFNHSFYPWPIKNKISYAIPFSILNKLVGSNCTLQIDVKILSNFPLSKFLRDPLCPSDEDFTGYLHHLCFYLKWPLDHSVYKVIYANLRNVNIAFEEWIVQQ